MGSASPELPVTMRLAVEATTLLLQRTGVGLFTAEILRALSRRPDVQVSAFNVRGRGPGRGWLPDDIGGDVRELSGRMRMGRLRWLWEFLGVPRMEWVFGSVDVVHGPAYWVPSTTRAATVVSVHDVSFEHAPPIGAPFTKPLRRSVRTAVRRGAWIHTDSDYVAAEVCEIYEIEPHRVVTVPLGVRLPPRGRGGTHPAPGSPYVLALGASVRRKDLTTLVSAFDSLAVEHPDLRLIHAGPDGDGADELAEAIDRCRHRSRILQLGWVDDSTRASLLSDAAAVAYPSLYEGFGFVPLEAMAAGRPVVTTPVSAIPEVAGDAAMYSEVGDADGLADALHRVLTDSALIARLVGAREDSLFGIHLGTHRRGSDRLVQISGFQLKTTASVLISVSVVLVLVSSALVLASSARTFG